MKTKTFLVFIFLITSFACSNPYNIGNGLINMNYSKLDIIRTKINDKSPEYTEAYNLLLKEAGNIIINNTNTINKKEPDSGNYFNATSNLNKNDFEFHEKQSLGFDKIVNNILVLTLAWEYSQNAKYANKAKELLQRNFVNPSSKFKVEKILRKYLIGLGDDDLDLIYEINGLIFLSDATLVLENSKVWSQSDTGEIRIWFHEFFKLMIANKAEIQLNIITSNFISPFYAQMACFGFYVKSPQLVRNLIEEYKAFPIKKKYNLTDNQDFSSFDDHQVLNITGKIMINKIADKLGLDCEKNKPEFKKSITETINKSFYQSMLVSDDSGNVRGNIEFIQLLLLSSNMPNDYNEAKGINFGSEKIRVNPWIIIFPI